MQLAAAGRDPAVTAPARPTWVATQSLALGMPSTASEMLAAVVPAVQVKPHATCTPGATCAPQPPAARLQVPPVALIATPAMEPPSLAATLNAPVTGATWSGSSTRLRPRPQTRESGACSAPTWATALQSSGPEVENWRLLEDKLQAGNRLHTRLAPHCAAQRDWWRAEACRPSQRARQDGTGTTAAHHCQLLVRV